MEEVLAVFPPRIRAELRTVPPRDWERMEEIRLRLGHPLQFLTGERELCLSGTAVTAEELEQTLQLACRASFHTVLPQLRQGYLPLRGGHRLGVCGSVHLRDGAIFALEPVSSLNLRLARALPGAGESVIRLLCPGGRFASTLILAPPGAGKTTLLRDVIRCLSDGVGCAPHRVSLADERGEVAALYRGRPQLEVGRRTDVLEGCPKAQALMLLLRGMNPQVLAADEITAQEDVQAMTMAAGCGVAVLCTAHGAGRQDLERRPLYQSLMEQKLFRYLLTIRMENGRRRYHVEELA